MPSVSDIAHFFKWLNEHLHDIVVIAIAGPGILVGVHHLAEWLRDYFERFKDRRYRVLTTVVKDLMKETATQTAKLRRLRVYKKKSEPLILDPRPSIIPEDEKNERPAELDVYYSVPGRLGTQKEFDESGKPVEKFMLHLSLDEQFKAHQIYSTLLVYTIDEKLDDILTPPVFVAKQPVGEESFTYEAHFPPGRRFVRSRGLDDPRRKDKPRIRVFKKTADGKQELRYESYTRQGRNWFLWKWNRFVNRFRTRYHVTGGSGNFGDKLGHHDWFRVTILKPPQKEDIHICWCMEGDGSIWSWCTHKLDEHKKT